MKNLKPTTNDLQPKNKKGFTLFFAVIAGGILLIASFAVADTLTREIVLSSYSKDSMEAFYSADAGAECAARIMFNDEDIADFLTGSRGINPSLCNGTQTICEIPKNCGGQNITLNWTLRAGSGTNPVPDEYKNMGCDSIVSFRDLETNLISIGSFHFKFFMARCDVGSGTTRNIIISKGYNTGDTDSPRAVERAVLVKSL